MRELIAIWKENIKIGTGLLYGKVYDIVNKWTVNTHLCVYGVLLLLIILL